MKARFRSIWERLISSLWFVPACMSAAAALLAGATGLLDRALSEDAPWSRGLTRWLLYTGDAEGARAVLETVGSSMLTVAGVTFSIHVVALSLASQQFGPRLVTNFMRDVGNQVVLGTFIATFLFCLIALGTRGGGLAPDVGQSASASIAVLLALASVAVLIYFIHHVAASIRAEQVIRMVVRDIDAMIDELIVRSERAQTSPDERHAALEERPPTATIALRRSGYLQAIDEDSLLALAQRADVVLAVLRRPGHFIVAGEPAIAVVEGGEPDDGLKHAMATCFIVGKERTWEQDPEYGIFQLTEVAVRALSPGVNDPHTAIACVDWLGAALYRIANHEIKARSRSDSDGTLRLLLHPVTFESLIDTAFDEIRESSRNVPSVAMRMLESLAIIGRRTRDAERRAAVRRQVKMIHDSATNLNEKDRGDLEKRYLAALASVDGA